MGLGHGQTDQLGVGDSRRPAWRIRANLPRRDDAISERDIQCSQERVQISVQGDSPAKGFFLNTDAGHAPCRRQPIRLQPAPRHQPTSVI